MKKIKEVIFKEFLQYHKDGHISKDVYTNTIVVLDNIYTEELSKIQIGDINYTQYGTAIIEWDMDNRIFSLEIGRRELGYFIEVGGIDIKQVDSVDINESSDILRTDITQFIKH